MKVNKFLIIIAIVIVLFLSLKHTYAMFTQDLSIGNIATITTSDLDLESNIVEFERVVLSVGEEKVIDLNITNSTDGLLYYGVWYEMMDPSFLNPDIIVAKLSSSPNVTFGSINNNVTKTVTVYVANNSEDTVTLRVGASYNETNQLSVLTGRNFVTDEYTEPNSPDLVQGLVPIKWDMKSCSNVSNPEVNLYYDCYDTVQSLSWMNTVLTRYCSENSDCTDSTLTTEEIASNCASLVYAAGDNEVECDIIGTMSKEQVVYWSYKYGKYDGDKVFNSSREMLLPVKADSSNSNKSWYNYGQRRWANAVLVSESSRAGYNSASVNSIIDQDDILAYYVWIPRYKYKVFNINKIYSYESYSAKEEGIDIKYENEIASTGTVSCTYDHTVTAASGVRNETCSGANGDYFTHPAFTFGDDELRGIWVGKFEISNELATGLDVGSDNDQLTVRILPSVPSWKYSNVTNFFKVIYNMQVNNNIYGLSTDRTYTDSHLIRNLEWGAMAFLTNSRYGRCRTNGCVEVTMNNSKSYYTGNAAMTITAELRPYIVYPYNNEKGGLASTTGNIYGIFDVSGGNIEYVMGNMSSQNGSYVYYAGTGGTNYTYTGYEKYMDTYSYDATNYANQISLNRSRLGDATGETMYWYSDQASFVNDYSPWFGRGGSYGIVQASGIFAYKDGRGAGYNSAGGTSRATLVDVDN